MLFREYRERIGNGVRGKEYLFKGFTQEENVRGTEGLGTGGT